MSPDAINESAIARYAEDIAALRCAVGGVIVGQDDLVETVLTAVLAGGHVLIDGLPGLGKTHLAKAVANAIAAPMRRIQCTPDLMPSDVTGSDMLADGGGLAFRPGPVFANLVLVDEINRAPPKSQAAFLEAMQEGQVTHGGTRHGLPRPFWMVATQNPIELEGTYPLPEAQLDRFLVKVSVPYPDAEALVKVIDTSLDTEPADSLEPALGLDRVTAMIAEATEVLLSDSVKLAAVNLILAHQPGQADAHALTREHFRYGASPRALQSVIRAARVRALTDGRPHVAIGDLAAAAPAVLRHRVVPGVQSEIAGVDIDGVIAEIVADWSARWNRAP